MKYDIKYTMKGSELPKFVMTEDLDGEVPAERGQEIVARHVGRPSSDIVIVAIHPIQDGVRVSDLT